MSAFSIHPSVDGGVKAGSDSFHGGTLTCKCSSNPVKVSVQSQSAHKKRPQLAQGRTAFFWG